MQKKVENVSLIATVPCSLKFFIRFTAQCELVVRRKSLLKWYSRSSGATAVMRWVLHAIISTKCHVIHRLLIFETQYMRKQAQ
ncbi:hypothetical protein D918_06865 [Trichuris suis]|nr:hypothetical protein D918_06865 [Trichuris suis]